MTEYSFKWYSRVVHVNIFTNLTQPITQRTETTARKGILWTRPIQVKLYLTSVYDSSSLLLLSGFCQKSGKMFPRFIL